MSFKQNVSVTIDIGANISQVKSAAVEMQNILNNLNIDKGISSNLTGMFNKLNSALNELETKSGKSLTSLSDTRGLESSIGKVQTIINAINNEFNRLGSSGSIGWQKLTAGLSQQMQSATQAINQYKTAIASTEKENQNLSRAQQKAMEASTTATAKATEMQGKYAKAVAQADAAEKKLAQDIAKRDQKQQEYDQAKRNITNKKSEITRFINKNDLKGKFTSDGATLDKRFNISPEVVSQYEKLLSQLNDLEGAAQRAGESLEKANNVVTKSNGQNEAAAASVESLKIKLSAAKDDAEKAAQALKLSSDAVKNFNASAKNTAAFDQLKETLAKTFGDETFKSVSNLEQLEAKMQEFAAAASGQVKSGIEQMISALQKSAPAMQDAGEQAKKAGDGFKQMTDKAKDLDMLSSRFKYFFSVMGGFQLFKRAIRSAVETIKELDAAMTQTAVVSTKTVGQMWKTLPEYSKKAKELAASMKDVYSAQTLYVQQGLSMDAALNLGVETLKMARVAGIDAATATDSMTAALRGFKMELNETSATRINDVYSKLAQNTASNVQEISTAMSKVASLASSANMSFENTAAYLSKIIETTREGAETAGTALKTVIARFSEVKKLYSEGELTGTTEEGEEVDVNKISKALREVGINMNEYFTGTVGLDTIFGELGKKWSSLTTVQQRYIATMAAGSRQQSRFIALMQDWNRTSDLMRMAYDAEGSGQEQFEKTLDSLDAKITKLKTEWQQFIMGIANNEIVKWAVDTGTTILSTINEIIDKLSGGDGLAKAILSVVGAFAVFKGAGAIVKGVFGNIGVALGTKTAGSIGIGAGLMGMKQRISTLPSLMPTIGRFNDQTGKWTGINKKGRLARINAVNLAQAHDAGVAEARAAQEAYNTESAKLAKLKNPATLQARLQAANVDGTEEGKARAAAVTDKYNQEVKNQEGKVGEAQTRLDTVQKNVAETAPQQTAQLQAYGAALQGIGIAAGIAAGALGLLANKLDDGTKDGEKKAKVVRGIATGLTFLSIALTLVGTAAQIMGAMVAAGAKVASTAIKAIPIIGWAAAVVSAIISVISVIRNLNEEKPPEEVWKEFEEGCEKAAEEAKKVQDAYKDALSKVKDISAKEAKLDELTYGTEEWNTAVQELNESILALVQLYPSLAGAIEYVNDHLVLNTQSQVYKDWLEQQKKIARHAGIIEKASTYGKDYEGAKRNTNELLRNEGGEFSRRTRVSEYSTIKDEYGNDVTIPTSYSNHDYSFLLENGKINFSPEEDLYNTEFYRASDSFKYFASTQTDKNLHSGSLKVNTFDYLYLAELMGGELPFTEAYQNNNTLYDQNNKAVYQYGVNKTIREEELGSYGLAEEDIIEQFYRDFSDDLETAINTGEISNLASALTFLSKWSKTDEGQTYQGSGRDIVGYFTDLWTNGGILDQNIPLAVLLQNFSSISGAQKDLIGTSFGLRQEEVEKLPINKEWTNAYLKYGETAFLEAFQKVNEESSDFLSRTGYTNDDWATYAAARGIENTEENYKENEGQFKLYLRYLIAAEETYSNEAFKEFDKKFKDLEKSTGGAANLIASGDIKSLTIEQIDSMKAEGFDKQFFKDYFGVDTEEITGQFYDLFKGIKGEDIQKIRDIITTWGEAESLTSGYNRARATGQENATEDFLNNIEEIYKSIDNLNPDDLKKAQDILASIDWANTDSINKAMHEIEELGASIDFNLVKGLAKATNAVSKFNAKSLEEKVEQLETARGAGDKLKEGKTSFTAKEYQALLETARDEYNKDGRVWSNDWVQVGLDEWVYIGNETNSLLTSIDASVTSLLQNSIAEKKGQILRGKKVKGLLTGEETEEEEEKNKKVTGENSSNGLIASGGATGPNTLGMPMRLNLNPLGQVIEGADLGSDQNNPTIGSTAVKAFKAATRATNKYTIEQIQEAIDDYLWSKPNEEKLFGQQMESAKTVEDKNAILDKYFQEAVKAGYGPTINDTSTKVKAKETEEVLNTSPKEKTFKYIDKETKEEKEITGAIDFANMIMAEDATVSDFDVDSLKELAGVLDFTEEQINQQPQQLFEALRLALEDWYNLSTNETLLNQQENLLSAIMAQNSSNQELLSQAYGEGQEADTAEKILQGRIQSEEIEGTYDVMKTQGLEYAEEHGQKLFDENNLETINQMQNGYKALALISNEAVKNIDNLNSALNDNWDAFKKATKGTPAYTAALNKLLPAFKKVFGDKVDSKWIEDHAGLLDKWAKGGEEAEEAISEFAKETSKELKDTLPATVQTVDSLGEVSEATIDLNDHIAELDGSQLEVGATANFGDLNNQLALTEEEALQTAAALNTIPGTSVTWVKTGTVTMPDGSTRETGYFQITRNGAAGSTPSKSSGGGGGGGGKEFKNDFDKYYNMVEDINELTRLRNLLETDYNQLLESENISGKAIYDNLKKQIDLLKERAAITEDLAGKREQQIIDTVNENKDLQKYAWWNDQDKTIEINWDLINKIKDSEEGDKVKEYVSKLEGFQSQYDEQIEALEDIESTLQEIEKRGQDQYISLEDRTRDALIKQIQDKIDEQTAVDEAINDTNQKLIDSIQKQLEQQRQERDNAKTEQEIADKETRLAYLQQDSSGANAVEIANLQKEIAEARENYTDQLIDQKISELQQQNEEAAEQRQQQIDLMQQSLEWQEKSGAFWEEVQSLIASGVDEQGQLVHGSELENLLKAADTWNGLSEEGKMKWLSELEKMVAEATGYLSLTRQLETIGGLSGKQITFTNAEGKTLTGTVDKKGNVVVTNADGSTTTYKDVYQDYDGNYRTLETAADAKTIKKPATQEGQPPSQQPSQPTEQEKEYNYKIVQYNSIKHEIQRKEKGTSTWKHYSYQNHDTTTPGSTCSKCGYTIPKGSSGGSGGGCFVAGTQIKMIDNTYKSIEKVNVGDFVIAYNEITGVFQPCEVIHSYAHFNTPKVIKITFSNGTVLGITPGHPILTVDGWKSRNINESLYEHGVIATWLSIGDIVVTYQGNTTITDIQNVNITSNYTTYNLEVKDCHTFLTDEIVVHNTMMDIKMAYATGGLNTKTGPAWLDGTSSHPELVLNARDTENFIQLKDALADLRRAGTDGFGKGGDNYYDIDVQVDQMSSDYDVDRAIDRIKDRIYKDGAYRNVNTLSRLR